MVDLVIRLATLTDVPTVVELNSVGRNHPDGTVGVKYSESDFVAYCEKSHVIFLVAEAKERIVGYLLAFDHVSWGYLDVLCIHPEYRDKSVGSQLIAFLEFLGGLRGWDLVELCRDEADTRIGKFVERREYLDTGLVRWYAKSIS
jgi:ribosomal protein S18 acetylase RimI-like enzyme